MSLRHFARGAISAENARLRMQLRGITPNGHPLWTRVETGNLLHGYPDYRAVLALNVRRTRPAHYGKAGRLGVTKRKPPAWSENEILRLHRLFPRATKADLLSALPGRSWGGICARAWHDGYRRPQRALPPTGDNLLDQILMRAKQKGWTASDLDYHTASGGYFSKAKWRRGTLDLRAHVRAVNLLGGQLRADTLSQIDAAP